MHCFTLTIGTAIPGEGIRLRACGRGACVMVGGEHGARIPIQDSWFETIVGLDNRALPLPECAGMPLPFIGNVDIEGGNLNIEGDSHPILVARPKTEKDKRVLVHLISITGEAFNYTGVQRMETFNGKEGKVVNDLPKLEDVTGIEVVAEHRSDRLIVMHPGAAFRIWRPGMLELTQAGCKLEELPQDAFYTYKLTTGKKPHIVRLPRPKRLGGPATTNDTVKEKVA